MTGILTSLSLPGILVGIGVGISIGFVARSNIFSEEKDEDEEEETCRESDSDWDEDGFLAESYGESKLVIVVRNDLKMGKGKIAAQCCHATLKAYKQLQKANKQMLKIWEMTGQPKDAGRTQIESGSRTVLGVGPGPVKLVDQVTGHLKLL